MGKKTKLWNLLQDYTKLMNIRSLSLLYISNGFTFLVTHMIILNNDNISYILLNLSEINVA